MDQFGIFAKYWEPGQVKSRLAAGIGAVAAARIYRAFLETLLVRFQGVAQRCVLAFTPEGRRPAFDRLITSAWELEPQRGDDLGKRMERYFRQAFQRGAQRVVLIGSDSPTLPRPFVETAFQRLADHDVVLGPSHDGGYYLIGAAGGVPAIFDNVAWGSDRVWSQTLAHLEADGSDYAVLPEWYDVDERDDLERLRRELAASDLRDEALDWLAEEVELTLKAAG